MNRRELLSGLAAAGVVAALPAVSTGAKPVNIACAAPIVKGDDSRVFMAVMPYDGTESQVQMLAKATGRLNGFEIDGMGPLSLLLCSAFFDKQDGEVHLWFVHADDLALPTGLTPEVAYGGTYDHRSWGMSRLAGVTHR